MQKEIIDEMKLAVLNALIIKDKKSINESLCMSDLFHSNINTLFNGEYEFRTRYNEYSTKELIKCKTRMQQLIKVTEQIFKNEEFEDVYISDNKFEELYKKYMSAK